MAELFLELFSEEIPAKLQIDAREKIKYAIDETLKKKKLVSILAKLFLHQKD